MEFLDLFPDTHDLAYGAVTQVRGLSQPLKSEVQAAFAASLQKVWTALLGMSSVGLVFSLFMKALPLHTDVDTNWGLKSTEMPDGGRGKESGTPA